MIKGGKASVDSTADAATQPRRLAHLLVGLVALEHASRHGALAARAAELCTGVANHLVEVCKEPILGGVHTECDVGVCRSCRQERAA